MKFRLLIVAIMACIACSVSAQTAKEVQDSEARMQNKSTACNGGPEAFNVFIAKFSTDEQFMTSRVKLDETQLTQFADLIVPSNFMAKTPFAEDDDMYYQSWGELQYKKAYLDCGWVDSYMTHSFLFERIDGVWYLSKVIADE